MIPVLTSAETQALDRAAEDRGVSIERLMERAGAAVARATSRLAGGAYGRRVVAVCGKGNNGGDALVAARHLIRSGARPEVFLLGDPAEVREPAAANLRRLEAAGTRVRAFEPAAFRRALARADVVIDGIFGTGFRGPAEPPHAVAIELVNGSEAAVVAVDIPSGVEGDTGSVRGPAVRADVTVSLGAAKLGAVLHPGAEHAGAVEVVDIGFPPDLVRSDVSLVEAADVRGLLPRRPPETHKRRSGVVLVVAGSRRMTGAARLVASGAFGAGAGLVTVAVPEGILPVVQSGVVEGTFLPLPEGPEGSLAAPAWDVLEPALEGFDAVAVGPGLSTDGEAPEVVRRLVRGSTRPVVADADALNAFAGRAEELSERRADVVVTPHAGEFSRLFEVSAEELSEDRVGHVRKAAAETRGVVLLKGSRSLVVGADGSAAINPTGTPALATGGTGDVLTGAIAALVARGLRAKDAAVAGAFVHGLAGRLAAAAGDEGAVAGDVAAALPRAIALVREEE